MPFKNIADKRVATKEAMRRLRADRVSQQGITNINEALALRLGSPIGEAKLRSICLSLNHTISVPGIEHGKPVNVNLLDCVDYGINHPVSLRTIHELINH